MPSVVTFYGTIIMALGVLGAIVAAVGTVIVMIQPGTPSGQTDLMPLLGGGIRVVVALVYFRLGKGLRSGERLAVLAYCAITAVALVGVLFFAGLPGLSMEVRLLILAVFGLIYLPPVVSAFRHWRAFH